MKNLFDKLEDFKRMYTFFKVNPHKIPGIKKLLCKLGRHDFELGKVKSFKCVELYCFYCLHRKTCFI